MGKRKDTINTLARLKARCSIKDYSNPDACWIWKGAEHGGRAAIWLAIGDRRIVATAPRAAAILAGKEIPPGGRAWSTCKDPMCCNPAHAATGTYKEWGAWIKASQQWVGNHRNISAAKMRGRQRSKINAKIAEEIRISPLPPIAETQRIAKDHGISISTHVVHDVRKGRRWVEANPFAGLGAR